MEAQRDLPCNGFGFASIHFEILNLLVKTLSVVCSSSISISAAAATYILPQISSLLLPCDEVLLLILWFPL